MTSHADLSSPPAEATEDVVPDRPPDFLTVEEAARVLRIGRTSAYQLAQRWCSTDGREGLPVVRVGRLLRVPRPALERLAGGGLSAAPPPVPSSLPSPTLPPASLSRDESPTGANPRPHPTAATTRTRQGPRDERGSQASLFPADR
jgi:excisionase family DNA binding protein